MDGSLWPVGGALIGFVIGLVNYRVIIGILEPRLRAHDRSQTSEERRLFERKLVLLRRIVLGFELMVLTAGGYFVGSVLAGLFGGAEG